MNEAAFVKKIKWDEIAGGTSPQKDFSPLCEIARVLVRFDHIVPFIVNTDHRIMGANAKLCVLYCPPIQLSLFAKFPKFSAMSGRIFRSTSVEIEITKQ